MGVHIIIEQKYKEGSENQTILSMKKDLKDFGDWLKEAKAQIEDIYKTVKDQIDNGSNPKIPEKYIKSFGPGWIETEYFDIWFEYDENAQTYKGHVCFLENYPSNIFMSYNRIRLVDMPVLLEFKEMIKIINQAILFTEKDPFILLKLEAC